MRLTPHEEMNHFLDILTSFFMMEASNNSSLDTNTQLKVKADLSDMLQACKMEFT